VGGIACQMIFLAIDIDSYELLLGLDFLMKIGAIKDVDKCFIYVHNGLGMEVEMLPLNMAFICYMYYKSLKKRISFKKSYSTWRWNNFG